MLSAQFPQLLAASLPFHRLLGAEQGKGLDKYFMYEQVACNLIFSKAAL